MAQGRYALQIFVVVPRRVAEDRVLVIDGACLIRALARHRHAHSQVNQEKKSVPLPRGIIHTVSSSRPVHDPRGAEDEYHQTVSTATARRLHRTQSLSVQGVHAGRGFDRPDYEAPRWDAIWKNRASFGLN